MNIKLSGSPEELFELAALVAPRGAEIALTNRLDQIMDSLTSLLQIGNSTMSIETDLVAAVAAEKNETAAARMALQALTDKVAALTAQAATPGIDPAVIQQAIADLSADTTALAAAIPATAALPAPAPVAAAVGLDAGAAPAADASATLTTS